MFRVFRSIRSETAFQADRGRRSAKHSVYTGAAPYRHHYRAQRMHFSRKVLVASELCVYQPSQFATRSRVKYPPLTAIRICPRSIPQRLTRQRFATIRVHSHLFAAPQEPFHVKRITISHSAEQLRTTTLFLTHCQRLHVGLLSKAVTWGHFYRGMTRRLETLTNCRHHAYYRQRLGPHFTLLSTPRPRRRGKTDAQGSACLPNLIGGFAPWRG